MSNQILNFRVYNPRSNHTYKIGTKIEDLPKLKISKIKRDLSKAIKGVTVDEFDLMLGSRTLSPELTGSQINLKNGARFSIKFKRKTLEDTEKNIIEHDTMVASNDDVNTKKTMPVSNFDSIQTEHIPKKLLTREIGAKNQESHHRNHTGQKHLTSNYFTPNIDDSSFIIKEFESSLKKNPSSVNKLSKPQRQSPKSPATTGQKLLMTSSEPLQRNSHLYTGLKATPQQFFDPISKKIENPTNSQNIGLNELDFEFKTFCHLISLKQESIAKLKAETSQIMDLQMKGNIHHENINQMKDENIQLQNKLFEQQEIFEPIVKLNEQFKKTLSQQRKKDNWSASKYSKNYSKALEQMILLEEQITQLKKKNETMENELMKEQKERRALHNVLQELKGNIRVITRVRHLESSNSILRIKDADGLDGNITHINRYGEGKTFQFYRVVPANISQKELFDSEIKDLIISSLDGYNVCLLCYGQTGSGKTYTMLGDEGRSRGACIRSFEAIFDVIDQLKMNNKQNNNQFSVFITCIELYRNHVYDLFGSDQSKLIRQNNNFYFVENLTKIEIVNPLDGTQRLHSIIDRRKVRKTDKNQRSSRSHLLIGLELHFNNKISKLTFVDLAGSERTPKGKIDQERQAELVDINQSLSSLQDVVVKLQENQKHIPYRNSLLTKLLSSSIGGNAKTLIIATVSDSDDDSKETLNTLNFADRVSKVRNKINN
eukprot:TRINITY_DN1009_c0_g1_i1.p1 TRINITY_DN1009_c0_g1~~TRINITY_DN1009_c0_g1_i1.p1  ORF type:complete len:716 (+),score=193.76 TRINITY_DN1009_c0_g1_i1:50-2197(+)